MSKGQWTIVQLLLFLVFANEGVIAQETDRNVTKFGSQLIAATYVKFIESAGGRMVPILSCCQLLRERYTTFYRDWEPVCTISSNMRFLTLKSTSSSTNSTPEEIEKLFYSINGAIYPGGHTLLQHTNYTRVGKQILELSIKAYDEEGDIFPIWGECLGYELVSILIAGADVRLGQWDQKLFSDVDAANVGLKLILPTDYKTTSLWKFAPRNVVKFLQNNNATFNNHILAISPQDYRKYRRLNEFFRIVSTSKDRKGVEFISTLEGKRYPVYLLHWHPAKSQFEWRTYLDIHHSLGDVVAGQYFANFLVQTARHSSHRFSSEEEERASLIFNYKPTDVQDYLPFVQAYFF